MPRNRPVDYGFTKIRGGHRWRAWRGHGVRIAVELIDEETGEWAVLSRPLGSPVSATTREDAWSEGAAMTQATEFARRAAEADGQDDTEFDFT